MTIFTNFKYSIILEYMLIKLGSYSKLIAVLFIIR